MTSEYLRSDKNIQQHHLGRDWTLLSKANSEKQRVLTIMINDLTIKAISCETKWVFLTEMSAGCWCLHVSSPGMSPFTCFFISNQQSIPLHSPLWWCIWYLPVHTASLPCRRERVFVRYPLYLALITHLSQALTAYTLERLPPTLTAHQLCVDQC